MATSTGAPLNTNKPEGGDVASTAIKTTIAAAIQAINDYVALDCKNILTTAGDTVYASAAKTLARLAKGTANQVLAMNPGATAPAWTSTLVGLTLTTPQINDTSADHQYVFAVSELAADRTVTLPLLAGDDEFVFKDHTQTLTNKTLTTPTIGDFTNAQHAHAAAGSGGAVDHVSLSNKGTNTHAQIDTAVSNSVSHLAASAAVHGLPASVNVLGNRNAAGEFVQYGNQSQAIATARSIVADGEAFTFPVAFSATPTVFCGGIQANTFGVFGAPYNVTTTGAALSIFGVGAATVAPNYLAIGS